MIFGGKVTLLVTSVSILYSWDGDPSPLQPGLLLEGLMLIYLSL